MPLKLSKLQDGVKALTTRATTSERRTPRNALFTVMPLPRKANRSRVIHDIETGRTSQPQAPETTRVINNAVTESRHVKPDAAEGVLPSGDLTKTMEN
ncbi:hypothetical protein Tco_0526909 [Tanacetum coccineum]